MISWTLYIFISIIHFSHAKIDIKDAGIGQVGEGDMALIFYVTLENVCEKDLEISVNMVQCCEVLNPNENDCGYMVLIGGHMGILYRKATKNVTLIYPNMYLFNRHGSCTVAVNYQDDNGMKTINKEIEFKTNDTTFDRTQCSSIDLDPLQNCNPVDCVVKYSGEKSFFNPSYAECQYVPNCVSDPHKCLPEVAYSIISNNCSNLNCSITKQDLEILENNQADVYDMDNVITGRIVCHHGEIDSSGQCHCDPEWVTTIDEDELYEPSLLQYHMCNIEQGSWNCVNKSKIKATGIIIAIFAMTVASKILILMCVLSFCYKHFKSRKACTDHLTHFDESLILCENKITVDECICDELPKRNLQTETVNVSFFVANSSKISTRKSNVGDRKSSGSVQSYKNSITSDKASSQTTSSSAAISFQTESESTTDESTVSGEEDYEIEFTGEEAECYCHPEEEGVGSNADGTGQSKSVTKVSQKSSEHHSKKSAKKSSSLIPDE